MGGRGSKSNFVRQPNLLQPQQTQNPQPIPAPIAQQVPDDNNTPVAADVLQTLSQMSDAQLAQAFIDSQAANLPNHLDDASDITQKFIFHIGANDKPMVLDSQAFSKFMSDNNIPRSEMLSRSVGGGQLKTSSGGSRNITADDVLDMMMYSRLNYIGGKHGGQGYGAGTYFDMNGGGSNTGYGGHGAKTATAVLNPATARIITKSQLAIKAAAFDRTHPQFAKATGGYVHSSSRWHNNNMSVYAMVMGYNVIKEDNGTYHNIIDRKALVYRK